MHPLRAPGGVNDQEVVLKPVTRSLMAVAATAIIAGVGGSAAPQSLVASETGSVTELERSNNALRAQLAKERARTVRLIRAERRRSARVIAGYRRQIVRSPSVQHALDVASATYGVPRARLARVAHCESRLDPNAGNGPYQGLFQFGTPLWGATPYRAFSRTDPYAASLAASWAFARGMSAHWPVCGRR